MIFFYKEFKSKKKQTFLGGVGGGARKSEFVLQKIYIKKNFEVGGGGGGTIVSDFFPKESKSKKIFLRGGGGGGEMAQTNRPSRMQVFRYVFTSLFLYKMP